MRSLGGRNGLDGVILGGKVRLGGVRGGKGRGKGGRTFVDGDYFVAESWGGHGEGFLSEGLDEEEEEGGMLLRGRAGGA